MNTAHLGQITIGDGHSLALIAGPCVLEERDLNMRTAESIRKISDEQNIPFIFKASYEKDNRGNAESYTGPGLEKGLKQLEEIQKTFSVPVTSDVHRMEDIPAAAEVLDLIQIPAYLCQQTSLLLAAGCCGKPVNVKKGQFLAPENIASPVGKLRHAGCKNILVTERGSCFGYNRLISDITCIPKIKEHGVPVVYDATHIVRIYGIPSKDPCGGESRYVPELLRAGVAAGADAVFIETHPEPASARCDASSMLDLARLPDTLKELKQIAELVRSMGKK